MLTTLRHHFLIGLAAHGLTAGIIGLGASSLYFAVSSDHLKIGMSQLGLCFAAGLLAIGILSFGLEFAFTSSEMLPQFWESLVRWGFVALIMILPTVILFAPWSGFHHMIGFGPFPFFYMVWNGEDPDPNGFQLVSGYELWFSLPMFAMYAGIWLAILAIATKLAVFPRGKRG